MNKINCYFLGTSILKFMLQPLWICILKPINQFSPVQKHNLSFGSLMGHANHLKWKRKCLAWKAVCYAMHYIWMWGVYKLAWPKENIKGRDSLMRKMHYLTPGLTELAFSAARVLTVWTYVSWQMEGNCFQRCGWLGTRTPGWGEFIKHISTCAGKCVSDDAEMGGKESQQRQLIKMAYNFHDLHLLAGFHRPPFFCFFFFLKSYVCVLG